MILEAVGQCPLTSTTFLSIYNWLYEHNIFTLSLVDDIILIYTIYTEFSLSSMFGLLSDPLIEQKRTTLCVSGYLFQLKEVQPRARLQ